MNSKLLSISIKNLGCIGNEGLTVELDNILCLVGNNNTGKSTVLRAYELAVGTESYDLKRDKPNFADENTEVEITVHISPGVGNIAEKWKVIDGDYHVVKSKWTWDVSGHKTRATFDPELDGFSEEGNAAGLDNVFTSRLPKPFRIGALESPELELKKLLKLIIDPIGSTLALKIRDSESELSKALAQVNREAMRPIHEESEKVAEHSRDLSSSHSSIFPDLAIDINIGLAELKYDPLKQLLEGSTLQVREYENLVDWDYQGTGSKRALFWSILQLRSKLQAQTDRQLERDRKIKTLAADIRKLEKERDRAAREETKVSKLGKINEKRAEIAGLEEAQGGEHDNSDVSLPGYMLLIDEPEIALHPNGIRAASKYLYDLAKDHSWQVMLTTHSPLFVNPFEDNTSIVRLSRRDGRPSPLTYRSDSISFSPEEKDQLVLLNTFDQNLAEMFFGQHPIIVEGDTEFASFYCVMDLESAKYPISSRPLIIKARGKFTILPIMKMLNHFKLDFSVLHDSDYPKNKNGEKNNVWSANFQLAEAIAAYRGQGRRVIHRISFSTFEICHKGVQIKDDSTVLLPSSKSKPFEMYGSIKNDNDVKRSIETQLDELSDPESHPEPFSDRTAFDLESAFNEWVETNRIEDVRFKI